MHNGERGNKVTPSYKRKRLTNYSGPGMAKSRQALGIALSQPLLVQKDVLEQLNVPDP